MSVEENQIYFAGVFRIFRANPLCRSAPLLLALAFRPASVKSFFTSSMVTVMVAGAVKVDHRRISLRDKGISACCLIRDRAGPHRRTSPTRLAVAVELDASSCEPVDFLGGQAKHLRQSARLLHGPLVDPAPGCGLRPSDQLEIRSGSSRAYHHGATTRVLPDHRSRDECGEQIGVFRDQLPSTRCGGQREQERLDLHAALARHLG